jgi:hypothetical protein
LSVPKVDDINRERSPEKQPKNRPAGKPFVKGQSGNPKGRPPKRECLTSLLKDELERINASDAEGRTWKELIVNATLRLAIAGNAVALREVWDRVDGKVRQDLGVKTDYGEVARRLEEARARAQKWAAEQCEQGLPLIPPN